MFHNLPQDVQNEISQSISTSFEQFMRGIEWDDNQYEFEDFKKVWLDSAKKSPWYNKVQNMLESPEFQEELTEVMLDIVEATFKEKPSQEESDELDELMGKRNITDIYPCSKAEVKYYIERLKNM